MKNQIFLFLLLAFFSNSCSEKEVIKNHTSPSEIKSQDSSFKPKNLNEQEVPSTVSSKNFQKSIVCKDKGGDLSTGFTTECIYENYTLTEAYDAFRTKNKDNDDGKFLESKMPEKDKTVPFKEYPISVKYSRSDKKNLNIELLFPGGVTYLTFKTQEKGVKVMITNSPD